MGLAPDVLMHLCAVDEWSRARDHGAIDPPPSDPDGVAGFIHLSAPEQVHLPANRLFHGRRDLVLLHIDPVLLNAPVRWEPGVPTDPQAMLFPHLYGSLPVTAVKRVTVYLPGPDGEFAPVVGPDDPT